MKNRMLSIRSVLVALGVSSIATASGTSLDSTTSLGAQGNGPSNLPSISSNGRYVAFLSNSTNLDPSAFNGGVNVFVKDRSTGALQLIDVPFVPGDTIAGGCDWPKISADGRFVCFASNASNLVPGDTNQKKDIFLRDRATGLTARVNVTQNGQQPTHYDCNYPSLSSDGRMVAFAAGDQLDPADQNVVADIYVRDVVLGTTTLASVGTNGLAMGALESSISPDGRYVAFQSIGSNGFYQICLRDLQAHTTQLVSANLQGAPGNSVSAWPVVSAGGSFVAFTSGASDLILVDPTMQDVFIRDMVAGTTVRASPGVGGAQPNGHSGNPNTGFAGLSISADGRFVSYWSAASNLVTNDSNGRMDTFLFDRLQGTNQLISVTPAGTSGNLNSLESSLSPDGRYVAFASGASDLVANDTNVCEDVFTRDRLDNAPLAYCVAEANTLGCTSVLSWSGTPSGTGVGTFLINASNLRNHMSGFLIYTTASSAFSPLYGGYLCLGSPTIRTAAQNTGGSPQGTIDCSGHLSYDFNARVASGVDPALTVGTTVWVQYYSRDPGALGNVNLSSSVMFTLQ